MREMGNRIRAITHIAYAFDERPHSVRHADEVLSEVRRLRPFWTKPVDREALQIRYSALRGYRAHWREAKQFPDAPPLGLSVYRKVANTITPEAAKRLRKGVLTVLEGSGVDNLVVKPVDDALAIHTANYPAWEVFVRHQSALTWHEAIFKARPGLRDYADWLLPYVSRSAFTGDDYYDFWLRGVALAKVPFNTVQGLAEYFQLFRRITHGNQIDSIHANYLLTTDMVLTADRALYSVLSEIASTVTVRAKPKLVVWTGDPVDDIARTLKE
jgi:hypothetical protein